MAAQGSQEKISSNSGSSKVDPAIRKKRRNAIKEAVQELIGPSEIAPEVMMLIKQIQVKQKEVMSELVTCKLQFKSLENLRLDQIREELEKHDMKLTIQ